MEDVAFDLPSQGAVVLGAAGVLVLAGELGAALDEIEVPKVLTVPPAREIETLDGGVGFIAGGGDRSAAAAREDGGEEEGDE